MEAVKKTGLGSVESPRIPDTDDPILSVHRPEFVEFLRTAHEEWRELDREGDAVPVVSPVRGMRTDRIPTCLDGRLSYFSFDMATPIAAGTWAAARASAQIAVTGAELLVREGERGVFGLCRPPGHHAGFDVYGGYCYLNSAAIAAQYLRDNGMGRVAILDVDYHHGNGTQHIFYARGDVYFASIHADPMTDYPYFLGHADEFGEGDGSECNFNCPLPRGTAWQAWGSALEAACAKIEGFGCDAVVVSLGVDTFEGDPISCFQLTSDDYLRVGQRIAKVGKPTLFVMEGGYAVAEIGTNVTNVLRAFEAAE